MRDRRPGPAARHGARPSEERSLTEPRFVGSFPSADVLLDPPLPEVAFLGRSNVGKSSLLNALAGRRIARLSATPGTTRTLNVYELLALYCLDLPGYGYARAAKGDRAAFRRLMRRALERPRLAGVVWLLDIRHAPSADDRATQDLLAARQTPVLAALTKSDTLGRRERQRRERELGEALQLDPEQLIVTSARHGEGLAALRAAIGGLVEAGR
ncbi:MAG TPA: ribosome biogenesis GTP-binding protein YihA/YsxC [Gemmatimonadales bacterium]|nr:ribosome biogenesis GTP-binding protein YihA/YsxC [Gemmatimonadales bacterium]